MKALMERMRSPVGRYVTPFLVFAVFTELQRFGSDQSIFLIYALKTLATGACLLFCFKGHWKEIEGRFDWRALVLGLVVLAIWITPDLIFEREHEVRFNPEVFAHSWLILPALFFRIFGASVVVPIMEELLWRSLLMRWLIKKEFLSVKLGTYTHLSFFGTIVGFMLVHQTWEWPVTVITGILYGGYLVKTKNLVGCMIAHAVTNLGLAFYILLTKQWFYW